METSMEVIIELNFALFACLSCLPVCYYSLCQLCFLFTVLFILQLSSGATWENCTLKMLLYNDNKANLLCSLCVLQFLDGLYRGENQGHCSQFWTQWLKITLGPLSIHCLLMTEASEAPNDCWPCRIVHVQEKMITELQFHCNQNTTWRQQSSGKVMMVKWCCFGCFSLHGFGT